MIDLKYYSENVKTENYYSHHMAVVPPYLTGQDAFTLIMKMMWVGWVII